MAWARHREIVTGHHLRAGPPEPWPSVRCHKTQKWSRLLRTTSLECSICYFPIQFMSWSSWAWRR